MLCPGVVSAADSGVSGYNLQLYRPATDPFGIGMVNTTKMLKPGQFYFLADTNFSGGQFSVVRLGVLVKIVNKILTTNLLVSMGITDFVLVGVDLPVTPMLNGANINVDDTVANPKADTFTTTGLGDLRIFTKWRILKDKPHKWLPGIGVLIYTTLPTGNERKFLGNTHSTFGATLIIDKTFPALTISANAGIHLLQEKFVLGSNIDDRFTYGAGISVPANLFNHEFSLLADISGHVQFQNASVLLSPLEYHIGIRKYFSRGFGIAVSGGGGFYHAIGNPDYRANLAFFWKSPSKTKTQKSSNSAKINTQKKITKNINQPKFKMTTVKYAKFKRSRRLLTIYFKKKRRRLNNKQLYSLKEFIAIQNKRNTEGRFVIEIIDPDAYKNPRLPFARLIEIQRVLKKLGINKSRLIVDGIANKDFFNDDISTKHANIWIEG